MDNNNYELKLYRSLIKVIEAFTMLGIDFHESVKLLIV